MSFENNITIYHSVITVLGLTLMAGIIVTITPVIKCLSMRQLLIARSSAAIGGLAGSLALSSIRQ